MGIIHDPREMQRLVEEYRRAGRSIGLVPTMGALHEGHLSLIRRCRAENNVAIMTLFVNPIQFNRKDDLDRYPRDLERDSRMARETGVDIIFAMKLPSIRMSQNHNSFGLIHDTLEVFSTVHAKAIFFDPEH